MEQVDDTELYFNKLLRRIYCNPFFVDFKIKIKTISKK